MSNSEKDFNKDLQKEILVGWHLQFAENQRTREQSFLKVIGFLGAILFGYAYVYHNTNKNFEELSLVAIASELILTFGSFIIVTISYNFRRDQIVNAKIREKADVIGENKIFPENYDPRKSFQKDRKFSWMPDFLASFYFIFPIIQVALFISYYAKVKPELNICNADGYITMTAILFFLSLLASVYLPFRYYSKLKEIVERENLDKEKNKE